MMVLMEENNDSSLLSTDFFSLVGDIEEEIVDKTAASLAELVLLLLGDSDSPDSTSISLSSTAGSMEIISMLLIRGSINSSGSTSGTIILSGVWMVAL